MITPSVNALSYQLSSFPISHYLKVLIEAVFRRLHWLPFLPLIPTFRSVLFVCNLQELTLILLWSSRRFLLKYIVTFQDDPPLYCDLVKIFLISHFTGK